MIPFLKKALFLSTNFFILMINVLKRPCMRAALFFVGAALLLPSCEKPESNLGLDLQNPEDIFGLALIDTMTILAYTLFDDSVRSDKVDPGLFGAYQDPIFGFVKASHITEVRLSLSNPSFVLSTDTTADAIVDSIILVLDYYDPTISQGNFRKVYGGLGEQYIQVFELAENIYFDSIYYDNKEVALAEDLVESGFNYFRPAPFDSTAVGGVNVEPQLRIPLKASLATRLIEASKTPGGLTSEAFVELFKGVKITVDETQFNTQRSGIIAMNTFGEKSRISMYYRFPRAAPLEDTLLTYHFPIRSGTGKFNAFTHDFSTADPSLLNQAQNGIVELGQQDLFIQTMGGTKLRIDIPHLKNLQNIEGIAINEAILTLPVRNFVNDKLSVPSDLFIFGLDADGNTFILPDQLEDLINRTYIGGRYDRVNQVYRFNFSRYLQQIINGDRENHGFEVVSSGASFSANRVVINGPEYPDPSNLSNNMSLSISYTIY